MRRGAIPVVPRVRAARNDSTSVPKRIKDACRFERRELNRVSYAKHPSLFDIIIGDEPTNPHLYPGCLISTIPHVHPKNKQMKKIEKNKQKRHARALGTDSLLKMRFNAVLHAINLSNLKSSMIGGTTYRKVPDFLLSAFSLIISSFQRGFVLCWSSYALTRYLSRTLNTLERTGTYIRGRCRVA